MKTRLRIEGMHCDNCVRFVSQALQSVPGVERALVDLSTHTAEVEGQGYAPADLLVAVEEEGYSARIEE